MIPSITTVATKNTEAKMVRELVLDGEIPLVNESKIIDHIRTARESPQSNRKSAGYGRFSSD
jgi:hypothetical protein